MAVNELPVTRCIENLNFFLFNETTLEKVGKV